MTTPTLLERFEAKYEPEPMSGCWLWTGAWTRKKYGRMSVDGRAEKAPRLAWRLAHGPIPLGRWVLHRCDNPTCVNPAHLFLGNSDDNIADRERKHRNINKLADSNSAKAHCPQGRDYTEENTYIKPTGARICRTCGREAWRAKHGAI